MPDAERDDIEEVGGSNMPPSFPQIFLKQDTIILNFSLLVK